MCDWVLEQESHQDVGSDERVDGLGEGDALGAAEVGVEARQVSRLAGQVELLPQRRPKLPHALLRVVESQNDIRLVESQLAGRL